MKNTYYFDMDGVLANFHKAYATNKMVAINKNAMANLEPFTENIAMVRRLIAKGERVYILTKAANEAGKAGKIEWIMKYIPEFNFTKFICIIGHGRKVDYIKEAGTLIDDDIKNTRPWAKAGYPTILLATKGEAVAI